MKSSYSFGKDERLSRKRDIQELFQKGSSFYLYPFRILWLAHTESTNSQVLISVSSRHFKKAVDRNLLKRRIREGYRLNKHTRQEGAPLMIALVYTAREILPSEKIHDSIRKVLSRLPETP